MGSGIGNVLVCFQVDSEDIFRVKRRMIQLGYQDAIMSGGEESVNLPESVVVKADISTDRAIDDLRRACISCGVSLTNAIAVLTTKEGRTSGTDVESASSETPTIDSENNANYKRTSPVRPNRSLYTSSFNSPYGEYHEEADGWSCDVCGGDSWTGCLYHDPTECRRSESDDLFTD